MLELHRVGDYMIVESLVEGAMGRVYKARDMLLDRVVAIKTIRVERIAEPTNLQVRSPSMIEIVSSHPYQIVIRDSAGQIVWQGRAPASVAVLAGSYLVRYESPDCADRERESGLSVAESQTLPFLLPAPARIDSIGREPRAAKILIDGREHGESVKGICLSPTIHTIVAVWPDGGRAERTLTLGPGQVLEPVVLRHPGRS